MDKVRNHILWLKELYELKVIDRSAYAYELIKLGEQEQWYDGTIKRAYERDGS